MGKKNKGKPKKINKPQSPPAQKPNLRKKSYLLQLVLLVSILLITGLLYYPSLSNSFTNWDDNVYVTENTLIHHPEKTKEMLMTPVGGNYHPLTMYTLAFDYKRSEAMSEDQKAKAFHITNLLLHILNIVLVFFFMHILSKGRILMSLMCALLFAIHPMHVESIAWITERKDVLYTFFFLLSLILYLQFLDRKKYWWLLLCFISFVLSVASKPAAVILPFVLFAIDLFRDRKFTWKTMIEKIPFFAVSIFAGVLTLKEQLSNRVMSDIHHFSGWEKIIFASYSAMMYIVKMLFPFNLSNIYPYPNVDKPLSPSYYTGLLFIVLMAAFLYFARRQKLILFGVAFFYINIILVLQFVSVGQAVMADRYTYVAYLGLFMILSWPLDNKKNSFRNFFIPLKPLLIAGLAILSIVCIIQTRERIKVWKNSETLWTDAIEKFPHSIVNAYVNRGHYYYNKTKEYDKALTDYRDALAIYPKIDIAWLNMGYIFFRRNQNDSSIFCYDRALEINPSLWDALANRGAAKGKMGNYKGSIEDLSKSLELNPTYVDAWENRALAYTLVGQHEKAIADYGKALEITPKDHSVINAIGESFQSLGKFRESIDEFNKAIALESRAGLYYLNRSYSWNALGDKQKALLDAKKAQNLGQSVSAQYVQSLMK